MARPKTPGIIYRVRISTMIAGETMNAINRLKGTERPGRVIDRAVSLLLHNFPAKKRRILRMPEESHG